MTPGLGRFPAEEKGCPLQYSDLENSMDCIVQGISESHTTEQLSLHFTSLLRVNIKMPNQITLIRLLDKLPLSSENYLTSSEPSSRAKTAF